MSYVKLRNPAFTKYTLFQNLKKKEEEVKRNVYEMCVVVGRGKGEGIRGKNVKQADESEKTYTLESIGLNSNVHCVTLGKSCSFPEPPL